MSGFATLADAERACLVANAALAELGLEADHRVDEGDGTWYISTSWLTLAPKADVYRSLVLGSLAVRRDMVACFECWDRRRIDDCPRIPASDATVVTSHEELAS